MGFIYFSEPRTNTKNGGRVGRAGRGEEKLKEHITRKHYFNEHGCNRVSFVWRDEWLGAEDTSPGGRAGGSNGSCVPGEYVVSVSGEGGLGAGRAGVRRHFSAPLDSCSLP